MAKSKKKIYSLFEYCNDLINSDSLEDRRWGEQLLNEWDTDTNMRLGYTLNNISKGSHEKVHWICEKNHKFVAKVVDRTGRTFKHRSSCRECAYAIRALKTHERAINNDTLREWCKRNQFGNILIDEFDTVENIQNNITLDNISPFSILQVHWKCKYGHKWITPLSRRTGNNTGCPYCTAHGTSLPEMFIYLCLREIYTDTIHRGKVKYMGKNVEYDITVPCKKLCIEYGEEYTHKDIDDKFKRALCNKCNIHFLSIYASSKLNEMYTPDIIIYNPRYNNRKDDIIKLVNYILLNILGEDNTINNIDMDKIYNEAYKLSHGSILLEDSLAYKFPELILDWGDNKNTPEEYKAFSNQRVHWRCHICKHEWETTIVNRTKNKSRCPVCLSGDRQEYTKYTKK